MQQNGPATVLELLVLMCTIRLEKREDGVSIHRIAEIAAQLSKYFLI